MQELGRFPDQGQFDMETVSAYGPPLTSRPTSQKIVQAGSDDGHSSIAHAETSTAPFITRPKQEDTAVQSANDCGEGLESENCEGSDGLAKDETATQAAIRSGARRSPALEGSRDSTTANLSDVCSEDVTAVQHPEMGQSSAMIRGGEVLGSQDGVIHPV